VSAVLKISVVVHCSVSFGIVTDRVSREGKAITVRLSVRPFVATVSFEPTDPWTWVLCMLANDHSSPGIESQGHR